MARFLVLYRSHTSADEQRAGATAEQAQAIMDAWAAWGARVGDALIDFGSPTVPTAADPHPAGAISGYSIMSAEDDEALDALLADHPHRSAGTLDVLRLIDMPGA